jgi:hypothetical protein
MIIITIGRGAILSQTTKQGGTQMKLQEIKKIAQGKGIKTGKIKKQDLIKVIQRDEGNADCFATEDSVECGRLSCLWREDCAVEYPTVR